MKTVDALFQQYNKKFIPAEDALKEFYGYEDVSVGAITKLMAQNKLNGLKPIRMNRYKYLVDIEDLARVLDSLRP